MAEDTAFEQAALERAARRDRLKAIFRALREQKKLTQDELAARVGIARQVMIRIEQDPESASVRTLRRIAKELDEPLLKILRYADKERAAQGDIAGDSASTRAA